LLIWPPLAVAWVFFIGLTRHAMSLDFQHAYLPAAHAVLDGRTPYPPVTVAALFPRPAVVYPPLTAFLAAPFTLLPSAAAGLVVAFLVIAAVIGVLYLLEIRDWRCYMIVFLWLPTYASIQIGNVTVLVVLGLALLWRYRHRAVAVAVIVGFLIALKLFVWPLLVWLVATRRIRAAVGAAAPGVRIGRGRLASTSGPPVRPASAAAGGWDVVRRWLAASVAAARWARIQRPASWSWPMRTSAAMIAALTSAASGFVIAEVSPAVIAIGRNAALIRSRSGMPKLTLLAPQVVLTPSSSRRRRTSRNTCCPAEAIAPIGMTSGSTMMSDRGMP